MPETLKYRNVAPMDIDNLDNHGKNRSYRLEELSDIDLKMKTTDLDANALLEMFIINL